MPSPFPGMDPYLESPDWFPNLHDGLITFLVGALMRRLPQPYYARSRQRVLARVCAASDRARRRRAAFRPRALPLAIGGWRELRLPRRLTWTNRSPLPSRPSIPIRITSHSSRFAGGMARRIDWSPRSKCSVRPTRLRATRVAIRTGTSSERSSPGRPISSRSTCSAAASIRRRCPAISPSRRPGRLTTTSASIASIGPTSMPSIPIKLEHRLPGIVIPLLPGDPDASAVAAGGLRPAYDEGPYRSRRLSTARPRSSRR